jgi:hypothetical protein
MLWVYGHRDIEFKYLMPRRCTSPDRLVRDAVRTAWGATTLTRPRVVSLTGPNGATGRFPVHGYIRGTARHSIRDGA